MNCETCFLQSVLVSKWIYGRLDGHPSHSNKHTIVILSAAKNPQYRNSNVLQGLLSLWVSTSKCASITRQQVLKPVSAVDVLRKEFCAVFA